MLTDTPVVYSSRGWDVVVFAGVGKDESLRNARERTKNCVTLKPNVQKRCRGRKPDCCAAVNAPRQLSGRRVSWLFNQFADRTKGVAAIKARILRETEEQKERERLFEEQRAQLLRQSSANKKKAVPSPAAVVTPSNLLPSPVSASVGSTASVVIASGDAGSGHSSPAPCTGDAGGTYESEIGPGDSLALSDVPLSLPPEAPTREDSLLHAAAVIQVHASRWFVGPVVSQWLVLQATWRHWQHQRKTAQLVADLAAVEQQQAVLHAEAAVKIQSVCRVAVAKRRLMEAKKRRHEDILARLRASAVVPALVPVEAPPAVQQASVTPHHPPEAEGSNSSSSCCVIL